MSPNGEAARCSHAAEPLSYPDPEPKPCGQQKHEEWQLSGQDGLDLAEISDVEGDNLRHRRGHHERKSKEPHASPQGVSQQAQPEGRLFGGIFDPHSLEDARQCIGQSGEQGEHVDHRIRTYVALRSMPCLLPECSRSSAYTSPRSPLIRVHARWPAPYPLNATANSRSIKRTCQVAGSAQPSRADERAQAPIDARSSSTGGSQPEGVGPITGSSPVLNRPKDQVI